jgi:hypothetical protein
MGGSSDSPSSPTAGSAAGGSSASLASAGLTEPFRSPSAVGPRGSLIPPNSSYTHSSGAYGSPQYYNEPGLGGMLGGLPSSESAPAGLSAAVGDSQASNGRVAASSSLASSGAFYNGQPGHTRASSLGQQQINGDLGTPASATMSISGLSDSAGGSSEFGPSSYGAGSGWPTPLRKGLGLPGHLNLTPASSSGSNARLARANPPPYRGGPIRVLQSFPDNGDQGVPITIIASVKPNWAREVGLSLVDERLERNANGVSSHFVVLFGSTEVEARTERAGSLGDSPLESFSTLEGNGMASSSSSGQRDLELAIVAHAPSYAAASWGGNRVPLRLKLVCDSGEPTFDPLDAIATVGVEVGEFSYWLLSPRDNLSLKRSVDQIDSSEHAALRRPASFPALPESGPASALQGQKAGTVGRGLTPRRPLGDSLGLGLNMGRGVPRSSGYPRVMPSTSEALSPESSDDAMRLGGSSSFTFVAPGNASYEAAQRRASIPVMSGPGAHPAGSAAAGLDRPASLHEGSERREEEHAGLLDGVPPLMRSTQLPGNATPVTPVSSDPSGGADTPTHGHGQSVPPKEGSPSPSPSLRAHLALHGNVDNMAVGWSTDEWRTGRRLVQFWRRQEGTTIHAMCKPILPHQYVPNSIVVSCIYRADKDQCFITSVDTIYLLEALVASRFTVEEKNRIRRNLEGFRPITVSKTKRDTDNAAFFSLIMSFPNPKPRNIEKDVKVFPWQSLAPALKKIIGKYSAAVSPPGPATHALPGGAPQHHMRHESGSSSQRSNPTPPSGPHALPEYDTSRQQTPQQHFSYGALPASHMQSPNNGMYAPQQPQQNGVRRDPLSDFVVSPMTFAQQQLSQHEAPQQATLQQQHGAYSQTPYPPPAGQEGNQYLADGLGVEFSPAAYRS